MSPKPKAGNLLSGVRAIALALPDTEECSRLGGSPHFYVLGKIFSGCGDDGGAGSGDQGGGSCSLGAKKIGAKQTVAKKAAKK